MGVFHLLHHEHQARYDKMFPYLWAYAALLALAGFVVDTPGNTIRGLYTIVTTEDAWDAIEEDRAAEKKQRSMLRVGGYVLAGVLFLGLYTLVLIQIFQTIGLRGA